MNNDERYAWNERLVYIAAWILIFNIPWLTHLYSFHTVELRGMLWSMVTLLPFFAIFLVNNFVLLPRLFIPGRKLAYVAAVLAMLVLLWIFVSPPPPRGGHHGPPPGMVRMFNTIIASCIIFGNIAIKMYFISVRKDVQMLDIRNEQMKSELESLKYQINPHFLMNTLNNIQSLIESDPHKAYTTIQELSKMMRYVLYENSGRVVELSKEMDFIRHYIELMKIRYPERVKISVDFPEDCGNIRVPPLMFITFIENAFKHGVSYRSESIIATGISVSGDTLTFKCLNSNPVTSRTSDRSGGGIGLENVRRRLQLLYGDNYTLHTGERGNMYYVELEIPIAPCSDV